MPQIEHERWEKVTDSIIADCFGHTQRFLIPSQCLFRSRLMTCNVMRSHTCLVLVVGRLPRLDEKSASLLVITFTFCLYPRCYARLHNPIVWIHLSSFCGGLASSTHLTCPCSRRPAIEKTA